MTYESLSRKYRKQINKILNLVCDLCGAGYMTDFTLVHYCDDCIRRLEMELG